MSTSMYAIQIHEHGGPEVMKYEQIPVPTPKAGEVLVKNDASGLNFIDIYHRTGLYKIPMPNVLGREGAGVVEKVGEGVTDFKVGDKIAYCLAPGAYAEYCSVPASKACLVPEGISTSDAAAIMLQGLTAHYLMRSTFPVGKSHTVLVHAGAGGLGQLLIQMCKHVGAKVITTVSTEEKAAICKNIGADHVIIYTKEDFKAETRRLTDDKGVNVVYDSVGKDTWEGSLNSLAPLGYLVLLGNASGAVPAFDPLLLSEKGSLFVTRPTLASYVPTAEAFRTRTDELFGWIKSGAVKLQKPTTFPLKDAAKAQELLSSRNSTGKILVIP